MPCYDSRDHEGRAEMVAKIDKLTRMLCLMCRYKLQSGEVFTVYGDDDFAVLRELSPWWIEHQRQDELKKQALNRLTKEERRALGL